MSNPYDSNNLNEYNPYQAPAAYEEGYQDDLVLLDEPKRFGASAGMDWIKESWRIFKLNPGLWILTLIAYFVITFVTSMIPVINIIVSFLNVFFVASMAYIAYRLDMEEGASISDLFAAFSHNPMGQIKIMLWSMVPIAISGILAAIFIPNITHLSSDISISTLFVLYIIVSTTGILGEFSGYQVLFFYAFLMLVNAVWEIFFVTVLEVPYLIQTGELDIFLVRPLNVLFQFVIFQLDEESVLEALVALLLLIVSICQLPTLWTLTFFVKLVLFIVSSILVKYAVYLLLSCTAFWWVSNDGLKSIFWEVSQLGNYPLSIYPNWLKTLLVVIPFGFIGYFPVRELLLHTKQLSLETLMNVSSGPVLLILIYHIFWKNGLKKYQSIGG